VDVVFLRMSQNRSHGLGITCSRFALYQHTFSFVSHEEINLQAAVLMEIIELTSHLT